MSSGDLLRSARLRNGLDQRTLAQRARTSQSQISRIERGLTSPSVATLDRLLAAMDERLVLGTAVSADAAAGRRVAEAAQLSEALTKIALGARWAT